MRATKGVSQRKESGRNGLRLWEAVGSSDYPGMTVAPQFGHRRAVIEETTGDDAQVPKTRSPLEKALQNIRAHPRGFSACQTEPEQ